MGQMKFNDVRVQIDDKGVVTAPPLGEDEQPIVLGKITRDGQKWVCARDGERKQEAFPRRQDGLRWLVDRSG